ncbi:MAG: shikimate dehydrogenase (NADP(+)) [Alphaproteobacteria bacterium]|nr:MAG: shikimate dehydrogenase (NADP(+)) [Alphaproteobacteria bacterium]
MREDVLVANATATAAWSGSPGTGRSVLVGLLGRGIQLSRTPAMHEIEGAAQGLKYIYRLFDTDVMPSGITIAEILRSAEICGFAGLNITYPYKVEVIGHLDGLSAAASAVGAVNTVIFRDGRRTGHNTDLWGFAESFRRAMSGAARANIVLLGAGGAGAAVAHALLECGAGVLHIFDADGDKAAALAADVCAAGGPGRALALAELDAAAIAAADGLVNATPVGMASRPGTPLPANLIGPGLWIADIVYFPLETELLRHARRIGCRVLAGSGMAILQAARAFEHFTGLTPNERRMEAAFHASASAPERRSQTE